MQQPTEKKALARRLHLVSANGWRAYDRTKQLTCLAWIDRCLAANVQCGRDVAGAIVNEPSMREGAIDAYDFTPIKRRECDNIFAELVASSFVKQGEAA